MTELVWEGKYRDGRRVTGERVTLPLETLERVRPARPAEGRGTEQSSGHSTGGGANRLILGDKRYVLASLVAEFAGQVNLVTVDPPFVTGSDFSVTREIPLRASGQGGPEPESRRAKGVEQKAYRDTWGRGLDSYLQWFFETAVALRELLAPDGSLYVHLDENVAHYAKVVLDEVFGPACFQREIVWRIGWVSGYKSRAKNWIRNHDTILFYVRDKSRFTFHKEYIPYPPGYTRRDGAAPTGPGVPIDDVWNGSELDRMDSIQIMSFSGEKVGYPTQKNESLIGRIVRASSNPGDLVLDCFCGSGTAPVVAEKLGRRWLACDVGRLAVHTTKKRLLSVRGVKPFDVLGFGAHERRAWLGERFAAGSDGAGAEDACRRFVLERYGASPVLPSTGVSRSLHGTKSGRWIHVGCVESPLTLADVTAVAREVARARDAGTAAAVDLLGWDFAFGAFEAARAASAHDVDARFKWIPREVLDERASEADIVRASDFLGLREVLTRVSVTGRAVSVELVDLVLPADDVPDDVRGCVDRGLSWVDSWAIDWDYGASFGSADRPFTCTWYAARTRDAERLDLVAEHAYEESGNRVVAVRVVDVFGGETTTTMQVSVT